LTVSVPAEAPSRGPSDGTAVRSGGNWPARRSRHCFRAVLRPSGPARARKPPWHSSFREGGPCAASSRAAPSRRVKLASLESRLSGRSESRPPLGKAFKGASGTVSARTPFWSSGFRVRWPRGRLAETSPARPPCGNAPRTSLISSRRPTVLYSTSPLPPARGSFQCSGPSLGPSFLLSASG
jgi:hypothetical protein